jgi:hypothetical protein
MDIIQKLELYPHIDEELKTLNENLTTITKCKYDISITSDLSGMPGSGKISNPTADHVVRIVTADNKKIANIAQKIEELNNIHSEVFDALMILTYAEKKTIELKHFKHKSGDTIWSQIGYSRSRGYDIYNRALEKVRMKLISSD